MINQELINGGLFLLLAVIGWFVRGTVTRVNECQRHLEARIETVAKELDAWRIESTRAHERSAGDAKVADARHSQNQEAISRLTTKVERVLESVPNIIAAAQADIINRLSMLEKGK